MKNVSLIWKSEEERRVRDFSCFTDAAMEFLVGPPEEESEKHGVGKIGFGVGFGGRGEAPADDDEDDVDSDASSSIGVPDDDSDGDGVDEEAQSKLNRGLASFDSLEDSLPIKRGLSNHFSGKSKSFANLTEACSAKDLEKPENPFNKRRRVLIQAKLLRKSSFYTWRNPKSMPLLALNEDDDEEAPSPPRSQPEDDDGKERVPQWPQRRAKNNMKSFSCFSLSEMENHHFQQLQE